MRIVIVRSHVPGGPQPFLETALEGTLQGSRAGMRVSLDLTSKRSQTVTRSLDVATGYIQAYGLEVGLWVQQPSGSRFSCSHAATDRPNCLLALLPICDISGILHFPAFQHLVTEHLYPFE